jgi:type IV secretion system protein TrbL
MTSVKSALAVLALFASLILPAAAAAETVVPPGNSAVTQYTEQFPTAGGNAKPNAGIGGGGAGKTPSKVLGAGNAQQLESKGAVGEEVAALAAETAPVSGGSSGGSAHAGAGNAHNAPNSDGKPAGKAGGGEGNAGGGSRPAGSTAADTGGGSSGLGEVVGQATGSTDGELGLLLPLILLGTVLCSLFYLRRERRQVP